MGVVKSRLKIRMFSHSILFLLIPSLIIGSAGASFFSQIPNIGTQVKANPIIFTNGEDTLICGGSISTNPPGFKLTNVPLLVGSDIVITELVNVTNVDSSDHNMQISVYSEDFGNELSSLKIYLVSPTGTETLVVELDNSGNVIREMVTVNIPHGQEWAMKWVGHYDPGTLSCQKNSITFLFTVW